jgi:hypothetical protein
MSNQWMATALASVVQERNRQDEKWGEQNHDPIFWLGILGEEFGELCEAVNESVFTGPHAKREKGGYENMRREAVQLAAVTVAFVEYLDRTFGPGVELVAAPDEAAAYGNDCPKGVCEL